MKWLVIAAAVTLFALPPAGISQEPGNLRSIVAEAAATEAKAADDEVVRIEWARKDVDVHVDGARLKPSAGLGSWAAFKTAGEKTMVMGDTVVFEDEITPAMDAALQHGLMVTALHNHFIFDDPPVYFMHIGGRGDADDLASGVRAVWDAIRGVRADAPDPRRTFGKNLPATLEGKLDAASLETVLEARATVADGVVKFSFPREAKMHGIEIGGSMGLTTWAAFSGSDDLATVDGDFIMTADEVQPVLQALRARDIHIVALHNHMIGERPSYYFLHYWGSGEAGALAEGIMHALDVQASAGEEPHQ